MTQPNLSLTTPIMIKVSNLAKSYDGVNFALAAISFEADLIHRLIFIDGPNGCGKTTLLKILTGEEYPSEGSFCLKDHEQLTLIILSSVHAAIRALLPAPPSGSRQAAAAG